MSAAGGRDPGRYQPDDRTFARVVPADDVQARAAAVWAKRLGARTFAAAGDRSEFGKVTVDAFASEARSLGMRAFSQKDIESGPPMGKFSVDPDAIFYGLTELPRTPLFVKILASGTSMVFGLDTLFDPVFLRDAITIQDRLHIVSPFLDASELPAKGKRFARAYRQRFGAAPQPATAYGYESMALLLDAIRRAGGDGDSRGAVTDEVLATRDHDSVLGTYSIDGNGDTTLDLISGYRVAGGRAVFATELRAPR